jgi:hypothetical protein
LRHRLGSIAVALALVAFTACQKADPLLPAETFRWAEQPISFSPPPEGWRREGYGQGGLKGLMFIKTGSVGEGITIAVHYVISDLDKTAELRDLLDRYDNLSVFERERALGWAEMRTDTHLLPREQEIAAAVNDEVRSARLADRMRETEGVKTRLRAALERAEALRFELSDVREGVVFQPDLRSNPDSFMVMVRRDTTIVGHEAVITDYEFHGPARVYRCREYWLVENNHPFTAQYIGLEKNVGLFDRVVSTITFPPRSPKPVEERWWH